MSPDFSLSPFLNHFINETNEPVKVLSFPGKVGSVLGERVRRRLGGGQEGEAQPKIDGPHEDLGFCSEISVRQRGLSSTVSIT